MNEPGTVLETAPVGIDSHRSPFFTDEEHARLNSLRQEVDSTSATIAYCVFENPFAISGGIFAVADSYSTELQEQGVNTVVISPFHTRLKTVPNSADLELVATTSVPFGVHSVPVELFASWRGKVRWLLIRAEGFFEGEGGTEQTDPYLYESSERLRIDSLFASAAVPYVLDAIEIKENVIVHAQDWEFATTALTVKEALLRGQLKSAAIVITSHNPYDEGLPHEQLEWVTARAARIDKENDASVYQLMMPLADGPIVTVSRSFAAEMTSDRLQTDHFATHLQSIFRHKSIVGVDNGICGKSNRAFSVSALAQAVQGKYYNSLLQEKLQKRQAMLRQLTAMNDDRALGFLSGGNDRPLAELPDSIPIFFMFGRIDPGQKGFDICARAIEALPRGRMRFVLAPIVESSQQPFVDNLAQLAESLPGEVVVCPFRIEHGFRNILGGASFAVMPSMYEPFGDATESYLEGTPVVARATGGLRQQVVDIDFNPRVSTGILYREAPYSLPDQWQEIQLAKDPFDRMRIPVYASMVASLAAALQRAADVYVTRGASYGRLLSNLHRRVAAFTWQKAASEYREVYETAVSRRR